MSLKHPRDCFGRISLTYAVLILFLFPIVSFAQSTSLGCLIGTRQPSLWPLDSSSPWNTPIGSGAVFGDTINPMTQDVERDILNFNTQYYSVAVFQASSSDPISTIPLSNGTSISIHVPASAAPTGGVDGNVTIVDPDGYQSYEFGGFQNLGNGSYSADLVTHGPNQNLLGSGVATFDTTGQACPYWNSPRATGVNAQAGLVRKWELEQAGVIRHALAMALAPDQLSTTIVWPAGCRDNSWDINTGSIPYGQLFAIPKNVNIHQLGLSPYGVMIAKALQNYGGYIVDRSSNGVIYGEPTISPIVGTYITNDLPSIRNLLRPVLNNSITNVGGGGVPLASQAPSMCFDGINLGGGKTEIWTLISTPAASKMFTKIIRR